MSQASARPLSSKLPQLTPVSRYDRVAGLLVALLILLATAVAVLLFMWLAGRYADTGHAVPVVVYPGEGGDPSSIDVTGMALAAPTFQEIERETDLPMAGFTNAAALIDQVIVNRSAEVANLTQSLALPTSGGGSTMGAGDKPAFGDGPGSGGVARGERWEITYAGGVSLDEYRKQLDFFGIELAAISRARTVEYVRNFTQPAPDIDRRREGDETRLFMSWRPGSARQESDRRLLETAGIFVGDKEVVQFIPPEIEQTLAKLEFEFAGRDPRTIRRTLFGVRPHGDGFQFYVAEQVPL